MIVSGMLVACSNPEDEVLRTPTDNVETDGISDVHEKPDLLTEEIDVSMERAIEIFNEQYSPDGITEIELDNDRTSLYYTIKGANSSNEFELEIDARTEEVLKEEQEVLDQNDWNEVQAEFLNLDSVIQADEAMQVVIDEQQGQIEGWTLKKEDNVDIYEVELRLEDGSDIEFKVDAQSGEILARDE